MRCHEAPLLTEVPVIESLCVLGQNGRGNVKAS